MQKKIIYITESFLTNHDYNRFGFNYFKKKKISLKILNITPITRKAYFQKEKKFHKVNKQNEIICRSKKKLAQILKGVKSKNCYFYPGISNEHSFVFKELNRNKIKYFIYAFGNQPIKKKKFIEFFNLIILYPKATIKKIFNFFSYLPIENHLKPDFIFYVGKSFKNKFKDDKYNKAKFISVPSIESDMALTKKVGKLNIKDDFAIYIDVPYNHSDQDNSKKRFPPETPCNYENYYGTLNSFFDKIKYLTGLSIYISSHPRAKYIKNPYNFGKLFYNKTFELINHKKCKLVFIHSSLAINHALIKNKPIIFLTQNHFTYSNKKSINDLASYFNNSPLNMSDKTINIETLNKCKILQPYAFKEYKKNYVSEHKFKNKSYEIIYKSLFKK